MKTDYRTNTIEGAEAFEKANYIDDNEKLSIHDVKDSKIEMTDEELEEYKADMDDLREHIKMINNRYLY